MSSTPSPTGTRVPRFDTLAERLAWARDTAPLTQQQLADALGISKRSVQNYESGSQEPKPARILLWANACDVDYGWLLTAEYGRTEPVAEVPHPRRRATDNEHEGPGSTVR